MKTLFLMLLLFVVLLSSCAPGPNTSEDTTAFGKESPAGFWIGLWHGIISAVTFFLSLFWDSVSVYEVHNSGGWYDFGFVLGAGIILGGGSSARRRD